MSGDNTLNLPVVQMGHVEKLVEMSQNQPHVQQLVAQQTFSEELKKLNTQVPKTDKSEKNRRVRDRPDDDRPRDGAGEDARQSASEQGGPAEEGEASSSESPWVGNLVNVKI